MPQEKDTNTGDKPTPGQRREFDQGLQALFEYLHAHPELSGQEIGTTAFIRHCLQDWGITVLDSSLTTGLIAALGDTQRGATVALRADIDALPLQETTGLPYASLNPGCMHACGHDFHTTALLGAAFQLKELEARLPGRVLCIFQPAEEDANGARAVIDTGLIDDVDAFIGMHNTPQLKPGEVSLQPGPVMAAVEQFAVTVTGIGTHAARPHEGIDTVLVISAMVDALQSIVSRNIAPRKTGVVSVTHIDAGTTWNVLPDTGFFEGTLRSFDERVRTVLHEGFTRVVTNIAVAYGAQATIEWKQGTSSAAVINDRELVELLRPTLAVPFKLKALAPSTGGEDFSAYEAIAPLAYAKVGANGQPEAPGWHHSDFRILPEALPHAVNYYTTAALTVLAAAHS